MDSDSPWSTNINQVSPESQQTAPVPEIGEVRWTASEFISHQKSALWYILLGVAAAVITLIVFIVTRNLFSAIVIAFAFMAVGVVAARQPATVQYIINDEGVFINERFYPYEMFKAYSVVPDGAVNSIWLRPLKKLLPTLVMYYPPEEENRIIDMLDNFLAQEERQHDALDRFSRRIRF